MMLMVDAFASGLYPGHFQGSPFCPFLKWTVNYAGKSTKSQGNCLSLIMSTYLLIYLFPETGCHWLSNVDQDSAHTGN